MKRHCSNCGWLEINPSGAMFCGYSDERTWENESCLAWKDKDEPNTNADRIRAMTDEELAEFLAMCDASRIRIRFVTEDVIAETWRWLDWLRQEVRKRGA